MNLRVISTLTSGRISGVDTFVIHLTEGLREQGVDARIVLTHPDKVELDRMPIESSAPIETLPREWRSKRRYRRRALRAYLLAQSPCIYLPNYDYDHSPISAFLPDEIQTVGILHSDDAMHYDHVVQLGRFWNAVVAVSQRIADTTRQLGLVDDRLHTIPYGIPRQAGSTRAARGPNDPIQLLYVGRLEQSQKRVMDLVAILEELTKRGVSTVLTMVGDGPMRGEIERRAADAIAQGRLRLLGTRPNAEMPEHYRAADVFLLTSAFEGLPVSLLEAMSFGCVPVVTDVRSGVNEVIRSGSNGFLVEIGNIPRFVEIIADLAKSPARREALASAARQMIEEGPHSVDRMVEQYVDLFRHMAEERERGGFRRPEPYFGELTVRHWQCRIRRNVRRLTGQTLYLPLEPQAAQPPKS